MEGKPLLILLHQMMLVEGASLRKGKSLMIGEEEMDVGVPINVPYYPQSVCISV